MCEECEKLVLAVKKLANLLIHIRGSDGLRVITTKQYLEVLALLGDLDAEEELALY